MSTGPIKVIATNRKARFNYEIEQTLEVGIVLKGSEVKVCDLDSWKSKSLLCNLQTMKHGFLTLIFPYIPKQAQPIMQQVVRVSSL